MSICYINCCINKVCVCIKSTAHCVWKKRVNFLPSLVVVEHPACVFLFCIVWSVSYDLDPKLVNCGLTSISLRLVGGRCMEHAADLDAKRGAKCEMMYIKQDDVSHER